MIDQLDVFFSVNVVKFCVSVQSTNTEILLPTRPNITLKNLRNSSVPTSEAFCNNRSDSFLLICFLYLGLTGLTTALICIQSVKTTSLFAQVRVPVDFTGFGVARIAFAGFSMLVLLWLSGRCGCGFTFTAQTSQWN